VFVEAAQLAACTFVEVRIDTDSCDGSDIRKGRMSEMKKLILLLIVLVILPVAVFADFGVGGAAFYKSPVLVGQPISTDNVNVNQFSFGGDLRFKLGWFQAEALALFSAGTVMSFNLYLDGGLALDLAILRLSLGAGPNFAVNFNEASAVQAGLNAKLGADIVLGPISFGLSYIMALNITNGVDITTGSGLLGVQVLFWL
jgi:hypothetical protein